MGNGPQSELGNVFEDALGFQLGVGLLKQVQDDFVESASQRFGRVTGVLGKNLALIQGDIEGTLPDIDKTFSKGSPPFCESRDSADATDQ